MSLVMWRHHTISRTWQLGRKVMARAIQLSVSSTARQTRGLTPRSPSLLQSQESCGQQRPGDIKGKKNLESHWSNQNWYHWGLLQCQKETSIENWAQFQTQFGQERICNQWEGWVSVDGSWVKATVRELLAKLTLWSPDEETRVVRKHLEWRMEAEKLVIGQIPRTCR